MNALGYVHTGENSITTTLSLVHNYIVQKQRAVKTENAFH